jgi:oleate hydratase
VNGICCTEGGRARRIAVDARDVVITTLGSMTAASAFGTMEAAPRPAHDPEAGAWALWRNIAQRSSLFGRPQVFCGDVPRSTWHSFTVTLRDPAFFRFMERFSGNSAGTGGLVTFRNSRWLLSIVLPFQPHFTDQPDDAWVFWGYALRTNHTGDRVPKPISDCNGAEILEELASQLPLDAAAGRALRDAICIPCALPYITSQFMPRAPGDRPAVRPAGARNFAFVGQFCEVPDDTVFTVEYSVRTAQIATQGLLGRGGVTPLFKGYRRPGVLLAALHALL